jgi:hypothetical protein
VGASLLVESDLSNLSHIGAHRTPRVVAGRCCPQCLRNAYNSDRRTISDFHLDGRIALGDILDASHYLRHGCRGWNPAQRDDARCSSRESGANTAAEEIGGLVEVGGLGGAVVRSAMMQAVGPQRLSWHGRPSRRGLAQGRRSGNAQILYERLVGVVVVYGAVKWWLCSVRVSRAGSTSRLWLRHWANGPSVHSTS